MEKSTFYWWLVCQRGCTWERTAMTPTPQPEWSTEGCPTCGAAFAGQVIVAPKVA